MLFKMTGFLLIVALLFFIFFPYINWLTVPSKKMEITVVDKTVPNNDYREHLGFFWLLDHLKITKGNGEYYQITEDYYGYDPDRLKENATLSLSDNVDLIYVADTYGVYKADLTDNRFGFRSDLLYGGLSIYEWNRIMAKKSKETTLIVEFNTLALPTDNLTRNIVEENLGVHWTGWIGRYFDDLASDEVPMWLKENYQKDTGKTWDLKGEAIVFVDENDQFVIIEADDFDGNVQFVWTEAGEKNYKTTWNSSYQYWFDIVVPEGTNIVEAQYKVQWTEEAEEKLKKYGIPAKFPAILHSVDQKTYYLAGDFADIKTNYSSKWKLPVGFYYILAFFNANDTFFWRTYIPFMKEIVSQEG